jgi:hypothetical protein
MATTSNISPPVALHNHCTAIYNNTLYAVSPEAFQSIALDKGGIWQKLNPGVGVSGATCTVAPTSTGDSLFVIGGTASNTSYPGVQRYIFQSKKWETIELPVLVAQNRISHGSALLEASGAILIYAGSQDGVPNQLSSQTFSMDTSPPYRVLSHEDSVSFPALAPYVISWDNTSAIAFGGMPNDVGEVYQFSRATGWTDMGIELKPTAPNRQVGAAALVNGDDGSRVLQLFDVGVSPNSVSTIQLLGPGGVKISSNKKRYVPRYKRDLLQSSWPAYNGTLASTQIQSGISAAQDVKGIVAITGGNSQAPLLMFDTTENSWVNPSSIFGSSAASNPSTTGTSIVPSTTGSGQASAETATTLTTNTAKHNLEKTLGMTLGIVFGVLLVLLMIFCVLKRKGKKNSDFVDDGQLLNGNGNPEKRPITFAQRGSAMLRQTRSSFRRSSRVSVNSNSSLAIISGKTGKPKSRMRFSKPAAAAFAFMKGRRSQHDQYPPAEYDAHNGMPANALGINNPGSDIPAPPSGGIMRSFSRRMAPKNDHRRSGWSRYFSGNNATNLAADPKSNRSTRYSHSSFGSEAPQYSRAIPSGMSATFANPTPVVPPLNIRRNNSPPRSRHVRNQGSKGSIGHIGKPTDPRGTGPLANKAHRNSHTRQNSSLSSYGRRYSSGVPEHVHESLRHTSWSNGPPTQGAQSRPPSLIKRVPVPNSALTSHAPSHSLGNVSNTNSYLQPSGNAPSRPHPPSSIYDNPDRHYYDMSTPATPATALLSGHRRDPSGGLTGRRPPTAVGSAPKPGQTAFGWVNLGGSN